MQGEDDELEIVLNDQQMRLSRQDMLAIAEDMLGQRQALLDAMGAHAGAVLVEKIIRAIATMTEAEKMVAGRTSWHRPCTAGRRMRPIHGDSPSNTEGELTRHNGQDDG